MTDTDPEQISQEYEAPAIVQLGSVDDLTRGELDSDSLRAPV